MEYTDNLQRGGNSDDRAPLDVVIVGAGFAGLYALHKLRGLGFSTIVLEAGKGVGGTWYWNRYPGARCDVESLEYSYSFSHALQQEWEWSERYASQPEILRYINHVADRFDLLRDIALDTRVISAIYDESLARWTIRTSDGKNFLAHYCIMATGCLSSPRIPDISGLASFRGETYHTAAWPHRGVDFSGKRVAVIGTGSSGIQSIPLIARAASHVHVFQRTPNFSLPARNAALDADHQRLVKANYANLRALMKSSPTGTGAQFSDLSALEVAADVREREYADAWTKGGFHFLYRYRDLMTDERANETAAEFARRKIRAIVRDPQVAEKLCPADHPIGSKRICIDTDYFETFNRSNVTLVDLRDTPLTGVTEHGIRTSAEDFEFDAIVFATGFDAMTGALLAMDIRGVGGMPLREKWAEGPRSYLGILSSGFPNLFTITGPGSPSVLSNMIVSIEQHVDWVSDCLTHMRTKDYDAIDAQPSAEDAWVTHVNELADQTLYQKANSWYLGANVPGKPRVFMPYVGGVGAYAQKCRDVVASGYEGFTFSNLHSRRLAELDAGAAV